MNKIQIALITIVITFLLGCASPHPNSAASGTPSGTQAKEYAGPDGVKLPSIEAVGWIESRDIAIVNAAGHNNSTKCEVLRCRDGHDFVLLFVDSKTVGTYATGPASIYSITGQVAALPPSFWTLKIGWDVNPFETMVSNGVVEKRDVTHWIIVRSIQRIK
jgi:hypothetical protein